MSSVISDRHFHDEKAAYDYVEARDFDEGRIPRPDHPLYRELWRGNLHPLPPPEAMSTNS